MVWITYISTHNQYCTITFRSGHAGREKQEWFMDECLATGWLGGNPPTWVWVDRCKTVERSGQLTDPRSDQGTRSLSTMTQLVRKVYRAKRHSKHLIRFFFWGGGGKYLLTWWLTSSTQLHCPTTVFKDCKLTSINAFKLWNECKKTKAKKPQKNLEKLMFPMRKWHHTLPRHPPERERRRRQPKETIPAHNHWSVIRPSGGVSPLPWGEGGGVKTEEQSRPLVIGWQDRRQSVGLCGVNSSSLVKCQAQPWRG